MYIDTKTERVLAMILHLSGFLNGALPLVVPLLIWVLKKEDSFFIKEHGRAAINFQLSVIILGIGAALFIFFTIGIGAFLVAPLAIVFGLLYVYFIIMATITASNGQLYKYPISWEII
ncbi:hypothetical protein FHR24_000776 [Wenyingzhuangia heitensis]|uniref:DUF4870 domain-containing protein n=1 Tax=Wenyingzhuangia heitensis TaxID=1487859 RepID=A0ABX0U6B7_9FLAO|nr:DUF4870 domain-containing protein [Wenyingzhuangia heitensis]NIJ44337.1 hypothetical protein [Wenyingzhuangia heitensis]